MYLLMKNDECFTTLVDNEQALYSWLKIHTQYRLYQYFLATLSPVYQSTSRLYSRL